MQLSTGSLVNWLNDFLHFDSQFVNYMFKQFKVICSEHVAESDFIVCNEHNVSTLLGIINGYLEHSGETRKIVAVYKDTEHSKITEFKLIDSTK